MGWDSQYSWRTIEDVQKSVLLLDRLIDSARTREDGKIVIWALYREPNSENSIILCHLVEKWDGQLWVKTIDECMGPMYYSCPLRLIKKAGTPHNTIATEWRQNVIKYQTEKKAKSNARKHWMRVGGLATIVNSSAFFNGKKAKIESIKPLRVEIEGRSFRVSCRQLTACVE